MAAKVFEVNDVLPASEVEVYVYMTDESYLEITLGAGELNFHCQDGGGTRLLGHPFDTNEIETVYEHDYDAKYIIDFSSYTSLQRTVTDVSLTDYNSYAEWEEVVIGYNVTFEENGGSTVTDLTEQTTLPSPLPTTTKANHVFAGWYYDNLFTQEATAGDELTTNVTLYAKWYTPTTWCEDIADAIREKEGSSEPIKHVDFPERILAIDSAVEMSQDDYDALTTPDTNTYYIIMEEE